MMVRNTRGTEVEYQAVKHDTESGEIIILGRTAKELREAPLLGLQSDERTPTRVIKAEDWRYWREGDK